MPGRHDGDALMGKARRWKTDIGHDKIAADGPPRACAVLVHDGRGFEQRCLYDAAPAALAWVLLGRRNFERGLSAERV